MSNPQADIAGNRPELPCGPPRVIQIDARGLEPPMPMVQILEAIEELPPGAVLLAQTDRRPEFLLVELPNRGFSGESNLQADGSYLTQIERA